ncbi:MAG: 30S ribosomal protein S16 [Weeksellaceae bacterium]|nr:30S ribosomal protein S16 [Weeksellaceae bacterium]
MATKIRLQRHGRKGKPFFHIVIADSRAKRDGRFIEKIGIYNPITNPATIELDFDRAVHWLQVGAEPTNTVRNILSYKGALMKKHLLGGVAKGAFSEEEAEKRFNAWLEERSKAIESKKEGLAQAKATAKSAALEAEKKKAESRVAVEEEAPVEEAETTTEEAVTEETTTEETAAETTEETPVAEEAGEETVVEAETTEEAVAEEPAAEESSEEEKTEE